MRASTGMPSNASSGSTDRVSGSGIDQHSSKRLARQPVVVDWLTRSCIIAGQFGGVAEWPNAPVLKTGDGRPSVGSNPTPSAKQEARARKSAGFFYG